MKNIVIFFFLFSAMCGFALAQSILPTLEKVKQLKLLESTRTDAIKLLSNEDVGYYDSSDFYYSDFYAEDANVRVFYSSGNCFSEDEDWNISEGKITEVRVVPKGSITIRDIGVDYSKLRKERPRRDYKKLYAYHDKKAGIEVWVYGDRVEHVNFSPSEKDFALLCDKPEVKEYYSSKRLLRNPSMKNATYHNFPPADVIGLDLSRSEIMIGCNPADKEQNKSGAADKKEISVFTTTINPMNDVLTYDYRISGGKIVGKGAKVVWDLSTVKAGIYKITAVADSGCGPCGKWITKTIVLKDCSDCVKDK
jgi:hypothetical protein